jgi:multiple sugar transport system ATP-binding protein
MARLDIRGLAKEFAPRRKEPAVRAVRALDLAVDEGELLVLVGPSGCGKSTVLRLVAGLEEPSAGSIVLDGRDLAGVPPQERDVAMVFQGYALYPHMTVREIIGFPLRMRGVPAEERARRVREVAAVLGLDDKLERLPAELSGGEQQRVAMGRAMVRRPKLFLFDEPLSNLDAKLRGELRLELARLVRRLGATAIVVTHDQTEAMTMADRVAVLRAGELQQLAPPHALYDKPANVFVAGFIGAPPMNLVTLGVAGGVGTAGGVRVAVPHPLARVVVGVRPEHVRIADAGGPEPGRLAEDAEVVAVEPLGAESHVYLDAGGPRLCARAEGFGGPARGTRVAVRAEPERLAWFDATTGARLRES